MTGPNVILDLSPIAIIQASGDVPKSADWERIEAVVAAWQSTRDQTAKFYGVADRSLKRLLDHAGNKKLVDWQRDKIAEVVPWADPVILNLATQYPDAMVITTDRYRDLRRDFEWLNGSNRLVAPKFTASGVTFDSVDTSALPEYEESVFIENREIKYRKMDSPLAKQLLQYEWACENPKCRLSENGYIDTFPSFFDERICCPECKIPAKKLRSCLNTRELVLKVNDHEVERIPLLDGESIIFGRKKGKMLFDVTEILGSFTGRKISQQHVRFSNHQGAIRVEDLGSLNGTKVIRKDGRIIRLLVGVLQTLELSDYVSLAKGSLSIRISGKKRPWGRYSRDDDEAIEDLVK